MLQITVTQTQQRTVPYYVWPSSWNRNLSINCCNKIKPLHPECTKSRTSTNILFQDSGLQGRYMVLVGERFQIFHMWHGAGGRAVPDVSEDCTAFILKHEADHDSWHWTVKHYNHLKHKEPHMQLHNITPLKSPSLLGCAVRITDLANKLLV